jgi:hypothetical protein
VKRASSFFLGLVTVCNAAAPGQTVRIYDLAKAPVATLEHALLVAGGILEAAGFQARWQPGSASAPEARVMDYSVSDSSRPRSPAGRPYLVVALLTGHPDTVCPGCMGFALPQAREGAHAIIFYDRVEKLCVASDIAPDIGTILGAVIAHELGHVLMGSEEHSPTGVMKARWGPKELRLISWNRLQFTPENKQVIGR